MFKKTARVEAGRPQPVPSLPAPGHRRAEAGAAPLSLAPAAAAAPRGAAPGQGLRCPAPAATRPGCQGTDNTTRNTTSRMAAPAPPGPTAPAAPAAPLPGPGGAQRVPRCGSVSSRSGWSRPAALSTPRSHSVHFRTSPSSAAAPASSSSYSSSS